MFDTDKVQDTSHGQELSGGQEEGFAGREEATGPFELSVGAVSTTCKLASSTEPLTMTVAVELATGASSETSSPSEYRADVVGFQDLPGEMRNEIYDRVVLSICHQEPVECTDWQRLDGDWGRMHLSYNDANPITYAYLADEHCCNVSSNWHGLLSLASTCNQVRQELVPLVADKIQRLKTDVPSFVELLDSHPTFMNLLLEKMSKRKSSINFLFHRGKYDSTIPIKILPALQTLQRFDGLKVDAFQALISMWPLSNDHDTTIAFVWLLRLIRNHPSWTPANLERLHVVGVSLAYEPRCRSLVRIYLDREATLGWWDDAKERGQRVKQLLSNLQLFSNLLLTMSRFDNIEATGQNFNVDVCRGVSLLEAEECPRP